MFQSRALFWLTVVICCTLPHATLPDPLGVGPSNTRDISLNGLFHLFGEQPSTSTGSGSSYKSRPFFSSLFGSGNSGLKNTKCGWPQKLVKFNHPIQSPIDLLTSKAVTLDLPVLDIVEPKQPGVKAKFYNSGHTVYVYIKEDPSLRPYLKGGPLNGKFIFEQMHFHWGSEDIWGSEHFIDGESFAVEIHMVHFNSKYGTFENAATKDDGLAVLTIFAEGFSEDNELLNPLYELLPKILEPKSSEELDSTKAMQWAVSALSQNHEYYTYPGSLTTEPYSENVTFILLPKAITLSAKQLSAFREIHSEHHGKILENKRQLQPLHNRPIVRSTSVK